MDKTTALRKAKRFSDRVRRQMHVRKVVLYGSHVRGTAREYSDVDIAVVTRGLDATYLDTLADLYALRSQIDLHIEPILLDEDHDRSGFLEEILQTGEIIYNADETG